MVHTAASGITRLLPQPCRLLQEPSHFRRRAPPPSGGGADTSSRASSATASTEGCVSIPMPHTSTQRGPGPRLFAAVGPCHCPGQRGTGFLPFLGRGASRRDKRTSPQSPVCGRHSRPPVTRPPKSHSFLYAPVSKMLRAVKINSRCRVRPHFAAILWL